MTTRTQIPVGRPVVAERPAALGRTLGALLLAQGLIAQGLINEVQLAAALEEQKQTQEKLGAILVRRGDLTEDQLVEVLARRSQVPVVAIPESIPAQILGLLPASFAAKYEAVPLGRTPSSLTLAMVDPTNVTALDEAAFRTGLRIIPVLARPSDIRKAIERYYSVEAARLAQALGEAQTSEVELVDEAEEQADVDVQELRASADDAPIVRLLNMVLYDAIRQGASDVHVEPEAETFRIRYRIDGMLREVMTPPQREPYEVEEAGLARDDPTAAESSRPVLVYRARGCAACNLSGYAGREGLYELMPLEPPVRKLIQAGAGTSAIREAALQIGMRTLRTAGLAKVRAGITSLDEVLRVTVNY